MTNRSKCVVVTGAAGALGSSVARHLASQGYACALFDTTKARERLEALANEVGGVAVISDITDDKAWGDALARVTRELSAPSHAVLIAGGWRGGKPLHKEDEGVFDAMMTMNLETAHASLRALLPGMVERGQGSIVVIGSRAAVLPWTSANSASYGASKAAVVALAQAVAAEVLSSGVRVNAVLPSTLDTPANRQAMPKADPSAWVALESAAKVIAFLLSDDARDVSGAAVPVYGRS